MKINHKNLGFTVTTLGAAALFVLLPVRPARASVWTNLVSGNASGIWGTVTDWSGGIPNATNALADFSTVSITANSVVSNDLPRTVGTLQFSRSAPAGKTWTVDGGTNRQLTLSTSSSQPAIGVTNLQVIMGGFNGTGGLIKNGNGALALYGSSFSNVLSGPIMVNGGLLGTVNGKAFKYISGSVTVASGASFEANDAVDGTTITNSFFLSGPGGSASGYVGNAATPDGTYNGEPMPFGALDLHGNVTLSGPIALNADSTITHGYNAATLNGLISAGGAGKNLVLAITVNGQSALAANGAINLGTGVLTVAGVPGGASVTLGGTNTWAGVTVLTNGVAVFNSTNAIGTGAALTTLNPGGTATLAGTNLNLLLAQVATNSLGAIAFNGVSSAGPLNFAGYPGLSLGSLGNSTYSGVLTPGGGGYQLGGGSGTLTVGAGLTNAASGLTVNGNTSGSTVLVTGAHTYGGTTTVAGGTLVISGTLAGPVTVLGGGVFVPGAAAGIGTLTVSNAVALTGTTLFSINRTNVQNADLLAANSVVVGGTLTVTNSGPALVAGDAFQLFKISGAFTNAQPALNLPALPAGDTWNVSNLSTNGTISVVPLTNVIGDANWPGLLPSQLQAAHAAGFTNITINPGTYVMANGNNAAFTLGSWTNVVINASNAVFTTGYGDCFDLNNCTNVTILGATMRPQNYPFTQGRVTAIGTNAGTLYCDWQISAGYAATNFNWWFNAVNASNQQVNLAQSDIYYGIHYGTDASGVASNAVYLGGQTWQLNFPGWLTGFSFGTNDWLVARVGSQGFAFYLNGCSNCTLGGCVSQSGGFATYRENLGGGNHMLGCQIQPAPVPPPGGSELPVVSSGADGVHTTWTYPGMDLENCVFTGVFLDDNIAIHGSYQSVVGSSGNTVTFNGPGMFTVGDPVRISSTNGTYFAQANCTAITNLGNGNYQLTLDQTLTIPAGTAGSDPKYNGSGYKIINCQLGNVRSRAIICKGDNGLITGNTIQNAQSAVQLGPEAYWGESDYVWTVTVTNNTILNCGTVGVNLVADGAIGNANITVLDNSFQNIALGAAITPAGCTNLLIAGNTITNVGGDGIHVTLSAGLTISNNAIQTVATGGSAIHLSTESNTVVTGNTVLDCPGANVLLDTGSTALQLLANLFIRPNLTGSGSTPNCVVQILNCTNVFLTNNLVVAPGPYCSNLVVTVNSGQVTGQTNGITVTNGLSIQIVTPTNGAAFLAGTNITLSANAADQFGMVTNVAFFQGAASLGSLSAGPYNQTWNNVGAGVYNLTAVATDGYGLSLTSAVVQISVSATQNYTNVAAGNWSAATAWSGIPGAPPAGGWAGDVIVFNPASADNSTNDLAGTFWLNQLALIPNQSVTVSGNALLFTNTPGGGLPLVTNAGNGTLTVGSPVNLAANLTVGTVGNAIVGGNVMGTGFGVTKTGAGNLILVGVNNYSGTTTVNAGELTGVTGGSCSNSAVTIAAGATNGVQVTGSAGNWVCGGLTLAAGTAWLDFDFTGIQPGTTVSPLLVNGNLALAGTVDFIIRNGLWTFPGTYPLVGYTGTLSGTVPGSAYALPAGLTATLVNNTASSRIDLNVTAVTLAPAVIDVWTNLVAGNAGGVWGANKNWSPNNVPNAVSALADFSTVAITANSFVTNDAPHTVGGLVFASGTGHTWTLDGTNNPLTLAAGNVSPQLNVTNTQLLLGGFNGNGGLVKNGNGALAIYGKNYSNALTGPVAVNGGLLGTVDATAFQAITGPVTVAAGASFEANIGSSGTTISNDFYLNGTGGTAAGYVNNAATPDGTYNGEPMPFGALDLHGSTSGAATVNGTIHLMTDSLITHGYNIAAIGGPVIASGTGKNLQLSVTVGGQYPLYLNTNINLGSGALTIGSVAGGGSGSVADNVAVVMNASNTYGGGTVLTNYGSAKLGNAGALGSGGLTLYSNGWLNLNTYGITLPSLSGPGGRISDTGAAGTTTLTVNQSVATTYGGVISNGASRVVGLTLSGPGALALAGTDPYSGPTLVNAGELVGVTGGSCSNSPVTVAAGATNGVQVLTAGGQWVCGNLTNSAGTTFADFNFGTNSPGPAAPLLVNGNLALNGTLNVLIRSTAGNLPGVYPLIHYTGTLAGVPPATIYSLPAGWNGSLSNDVANKNIDLVVAASPNAVSVKLLGGFVGLLPADAAGAVAEPNWNNLGTGLSSNLVSSAGATVTTYVNVIAGTAQADSQGPTNGATGGNAKLLGGFIGPAGTVIAVSNVPYSSYNVYVYVAGTANGGPAYGMLTNNFGILGSNNYATCSVTFSNGAGGLISAGTFVAAAASGATNYANYILFTNLGSPAFTWVGNRLDGVSTVGPAGFQIVQVGGTGPQNRVVLPPASHFGYPTIVGSPVLLTGGQFQAGFQGVASHTYRIDRAMAVTGPWETGWTNITAGATGLFQLTDPNPGGSSSRFYRVNP